MQPEELEPLVRAGRKRPLYVPSPEHAVDYGREVVERLLPHRDPFLLVDGIEAVDLSGLAIAGRRRIDPSDPLFKGHFPGSPLYPGVLQVEAMGQVGLCLFGLKHGHARVAGSGPQDVRALKIHHAAFFEPVRPGDQLTLCAKVLEAGDYTGLAAGQILRGETIISFAITEVYFVDA